MRHGRIYFPLQTGQTFNVGGSLNTFLVFGVLSRLHLPHHLQRLGKGDLSRPSADCLFAVRCSHQKEDSELMKWRDLLSEALASLCGQMASKMFLTPEGYLSETQPGCLTHEQTSPGARRRSFSPEYFNNADRQREIRPGVKEER